MPSWKLETLRILDDGPRNEEDWPIAADLIDNGLAKGDHIRDSTGMKANGIAALMWKGTTLTGREYADELRDRIARASFGHKVRTFLVWAGGVAVGVASQILVSWYNCP